MILIKIHKKRRLKKKDLIIMSKYLLEIGTEELPYKFIDAGQEQLKAAFEKLLKENEIGFSSVKTYGTPRRLTVIIDGLNEKQPDTAKTALNRPPCTKKITMSTQKSRKKANSPAMFSLKTLKTSF